MKGLMLSTFYASKKSMITYFIVSIFASILLASTMLAGAGSLVFLGKDSIKKALPAIVLFVLNLIILIYLLIV